MTSLHAASSIDISHAGHCPAPVDPHGADLSRLERTVVAIGVADAKDGKRLVANPHSRLERLIRLVAARRTPATLADPRLEALRHFAQITAQMGERIADIRRLHDAGFDLGQVVIAARLSRGQGLPG